MSTQVTKSFSITPQESVILEELREKHGIMNITVLREGIKHVIESRGISLENNEENT